MNAEIGQFSLILALAFAMLGGIIPLSGVVFNKPLLQKSAVIYSRGLFLFLSLAFLCLIASFIQDDFSVLYVASTSSKQLPFFYKLCAVWGGHEGSMLLWVMILSTWMLAVSFYRKALSDEMLARVLVVLCWVAAGFLLFILTTSNPFLRLFENMPENGRDLNPLLQDPGFLFHPPMLYMGYVGFSVAFAFAVAALWAGDIKGDWARWTKPWTMAAWCCLTAGITLGSWWAYRELGWGGWWFWDPVENASFMPWLVGTALIHSLVVTAKRGAFATWTVLLALCAFCLSLIGTFLVRSGVLTSVHSFAVDPARGLYMLIFLFVVIGFSLTLFAFRCHLLQKEVKYNIGARESFLILNNILLTVAMLTVLLGTLYPLIIDGLGLGKLSVGAPYFNAVFIPLFIPILILIGLAPHANWGKDSIRDIIYKVWPSFIISLLLTIVTISLMSFKFNVSAAFACLLFYWVIVSSLQNVYTTLRSGRRVMLSQLAMLIAHTGLAVTVLGISISSQYGQERFVSLTPGQQIELAGFTIGFKSLNELTGPNYRGVEAAFSIRDGNSKSSKIIYPQKRRYDVQESVMTDSAIDVSLFKDLYIALGEPLTGQSWSVRIYYKPFVRWIWAGGFMILFGGLFGLMSSRKKIGIKSNQKIEVSG